MTDDHYPIYPKAEFFTGVVAGAPLDADGAGRCLPEQGRHFWPFGDAPPHAFRRCECGARWFGETR